MPGYNFKKAFYGKRNRQIYQGFKRGAGRVLKEAGRSGMRQLRREVGGAIRRYGPMMVSSLAGAGDYIVKPKSSANASHYRVGQHGFGDRGEMGKHHYSRGGSAKNPRVNVEKGCMRIAHSEYVGVLVSSGTTGTSNFVTQSYPIQPASAAFAPWLSSIAINFMQYHFHKCVFEYRPYVSESTSTSAATLTSMGAVAMATQYNSVMGPFTTYQQMAESDFSVTIKPSEHGLHAIECNPKYNPLGVQYTSAQTSLTVGANSSDIRMQNLGIFTIASSNIPIASNTAISLGEIWVHYDIELEKPVINAYLGGLQSSHYYGNSSTGSPATTTPFGASVSATVQPTAVADNLLGLTFTTTAFTFPLAITSGQYLCCYYCRGSTAAIAYGNPSVVNGSIISAWNAGTLGSTGVGTQGTGPQTTITAAQLSMSFIVQVNAPGSALCTVTLSTTVVPTSGQFDLIVTPYNFNME